MAGDLVFTLGWSDGKEAVRCLSAKDGMPFWSQSYGCPRRPRFHTGDGNMAMFSK